MIKHTINHWKFQQLRKLNYYIFCLEPHFQESIVEYIRGIPANVCKRDF